MVQNIIPEVWQVLDCLNLQTIFLWFLKVSWIASRFRIKFMWSFTSPGMSWKLQDIFLWFSKVSWIASRFKITFLKFVKFWNVMENQKYFSMIFKSLLDCLKVQNNIPEVCQVLECLGNSKIFFYDFHKSPGLPEGSK